MLTADKNARRVAGVDRQFGVKLAESFYVGSLVCLDTNGELVKGTTAVDLTAVGVSKDQVLSAVSGTVANVEAGIFCFKNSADADEITLAEIGSDCYIVDDETVALTDGGGTRSKGGQIWNIDSYGVWVEVGR